MSTRLFAGLLADAVMVPHPGLSADANRVHCACRPFPMSKQSHGWQALRSQRPTRILGYSSHPRRSPRSGLRSCSGCGSLTIRRAAPKFDGRVRVPGMLPGTCHGASSGR
jgi:hypothetical protein